MGDPYKIKKLLTLLKCSFSNTYELENICIVEQENSFDSDFICLKCMLTYVEHINCQYMQNQVENSHDKARNGTQISLSSYLWDMGKQYNSRSTASHLRLYCLLTGISSKTEIENNKILLLLELKCAHLL